MERLNTSAPFSTLYNPQKNEQWQSTKEIYADFDSYTQTRIVAVASFAEIFSDSKLPQDLPNSMQTSGLQLQNDNFSTYKEHNYGDGPSFMQTSEAHQQVNNIEMLSIKQNDNRPFFMQMAEVQQANNNVKMVEQCNNRPTCMQTSGTQHQTNNGEMVQNEQYNNEPGFIGVTGSQQKVNAKATPLQKTIHPVSMPTTAKVQKKKKVRVTKKKTLVKEAIVTEEGQKPRMSFTALNRMAIRNSANGFLRVEDIYAFICQKYSYYRNLDPISAKIWKSSIRHSLTTGGSFVKRRAPTYHHLKQRRYEWGLDPSRLIKAPQKSTDNTQLIASPVPSYIESSNTQLNSYSVPYYVESYDNMKKNGLTVPCYSEMEE